MDEKKAGCGTLQPLRNQQESGNRLYPVQTEDEPLQSVMIMLFSAHNLRRRRFMLPWKITQQSPEGIAAAALVRGKCVFGFGFSHYIPRGRFQPDSNATGQKRCLR